MESFTENTAAAGKVSCRNPAHHGSCVIMRMGVEKAGTENRGKCVRTPHSRQPERDSRVKNEDKSSLQPRSMSTSSPGSPR